MINKITIIIYLVAIILLILIFILNIDDKFRTNTEKYRFANDKNDWLCRYNTINRIKDWDSNFIKVIHPHTTSCVKIANGGSLFVIDDPFKSTCKSVDEKMLKRIVPNYDKLGVVASENWVGGPTVFHWPIGLESKLVINENQKDNFAHFKQLVAQRNNFNDRKKRVLCNDTLNIYKQPTSGQQDDRSLLLRAVQDMPTLVDIWEKRKERKECLSSMSEYAAEAAPEGDGIDTHRFYEDYAFNTRRIVRKGKLTPLHSQFPGTIVLNNWSEIKDVNLEEQPPGPIELLRVSTWLYKSLRSRCRIVTFFTHGLSEEWDNLRLSLVRLNLHDLMRTYTLDEKAFQFALSKNCGEVIKHEMQVAYPNAKWGTREFFNIVMQKNIVILDALSKGFFAFYLDTDVVVLHDIIADYFRLPSKDLYIQSDEYTLNVNKKSAINKCTGVMFFSPCARNIALLEAAKLDDTQHGCIGNSGADQCALNRELKKVSPDRYEILDPIKYPNGARYFDLKGFPRIAAFLVHNNYIVGTANKVARFKQYGLWAPRGDLIYM